MHSRQQHKPLDFLRGSIDKVILIKVKKNRLFRAKLKGYDEHLNLFLEEATQIFEYQDEDGNIREENENLGRIVIRGDNIVFLNLAQ